MAWGAAMENRPEERTGDALDMRWNILASLGSAQILQLWWIERVDDAEALQWGNRSEASVGGHEDQFIPETFRRSDGARQLDGVQAT
jgi:hypothetical protein